MKNQDHKEHHIDELFARKLGNLEGTPSANAWQTLEKGLARQAGKKNKVVFWLPYAVAAAIALVVVSVWLLRQQMPGDANNSGLADKGQKELPKEHNRPAIAQDMPQSKDSITPVPDLSASQEQIAMQEKSTNHDNLQKEAFEKEKIAKKSALQPVREGVKEEKTTKPAIASLENTIARMEKQASVITPSSLQAEESTTIVVTVKLDEEVEPTNTVPAEEWQETEQGQKQSKAGKFFSTLKKIKKGDFDELGIKPETIVAYVKDRAASGNSSHEK
jgi:hypothetical protein